MIKNDIETKMIKRQGDDQKTNHVENNLRHYNNHTGLVKGWNIERSRGTCGYIGVQGEHLVHSFCWFVYDVPVSFCVVPVVVLCPIGGSLAAFAPPVFLQFFFQQLHGSDDAPLYCFTMILYPRPVRKCCDGVVSL